MTALVGAAVKGGKARCRRYEFDIPFVGTLDVELNGLTRGRTFFDHLRHPCGSIEFWAGSVHVEFARDTTIRPSRAALYLFALGWTAGHFGHFLSLG